MPAAPCVSHMLNVEERILIMEAEKRVGEGAFGDNVGKHGNNGRSGILKLYSSVSLHSAGLRGHARPADQESDSCVGPPHTSRCVRFDEKVLIKQYNQVINLSE